MSNDERVSLGTIYTKIPEGHDFIVNEFISKCHDYKPELTADKLSKMRVQDYRAVSCGTLQEKKICSELCDRIKKSKSPLAFYFRATNNANAAAELDAKIADTRYYILSDKFFYYEDKAWHSISNFAMRIVESRTRLDQQIPDQEAEFIVEIMFEGKQFNARMKAQEFYDNARLSSLIMRYIKIPAFDL